MRIIAMCGKGGVGKSTLAASLALRAAALGQRTLLFSVDPAHSLGTMLGQPLGHEPAAICDRLWAAELESAQSLEHDWADLRAYVQSLLESQGYEGRLGAELTRWPGVDEFAALLRLKQFYDSGQFDTLILDNAPTAFAMRLLGLPPIFAWYAKQAVKLYERHGAQLLLMAPMLGGSLPLPGTPLIQRALSLIEQLRGLPAILQDPAITSLRLVLTPDRLALDEARRAYQHWTLDGLNVDAVLLNRTLPASLTDPFFASRRTSEAAIRGEAGTLFDLAVREVPLTAEEPIGLEALERFAAAAWPDSNPTAPLSDDRA
ncbi:MAG TPA: ArsA family ATPase, partial [Oscillatoriaceae cyanobacterium]